MSGPSCFFLSLAAFELGFASFLQAQLLTLFSHFWPIDAYSICRPSNMIFSIQYTPKKNKLLAQINRAGKFFFCPLPPPPKKKMRLNETGLQRRP